MYSRILVTSALLIPSVGALAVAQYPGYGGYPAYTGYYGGGATAAGSAASGAANVIQAQGQRNLSNSQAAINAEQARSMDLDNQLKYTQTFYEKQAIHDEHKQAEYAKDRRSAEDYKRYAHAAAPKRMTYSQLDPVTGQLAWPDALTSDDFADSRQTIDKLFAERASSSGAIGYKKVTEVRKTAEAMQAKLKGSISDIPPDDYIAAKSFLESVANEARYPAHNPPPGGSQAG